MLNFKAKLLSFFLLTCFLNVNVYANENKSEDKNFKLRRAECNKKHMNKDMHPAILEYINSHCARNARGKYTKKMSKCIFNMFKRLRNESQLDYAVYMSRYCKVKFDKK